MHHLIIQYAPIYYIRSINLVSDKVCDLTYQINAMKTIAIPLHYLCFLKSCASNDKVIQYAKKYTAQILC